MASGDTKTEAMLNALGNGGSADEFRGCCNTKTQQYILDAIDRVQNVEDEVEELKNNPDVVDIVDTYADLQAYDTQHLSDNDIIRVLADETHSGNSTYYKFNKQAGTWTFIGEIAVGGGGVKELTSADYNWPTNNPDGVAMWLLPDGVYEDKTTLGLLYPDKNASKFLCHLFIKYSNPTDSVMIYYDEQDHVWKYWQTTTDTGARVGFGRLSPNVVQTTGTSTTDVMSQNAVTSMVFADPATQEKIKIGAGTSTSEGSDGIEIGHLAAATGTNSVAIGRNAQANDYIGSIALGANSVAYGQGSIALGINSGSNATTQGVMYINAGNTMYGYNNSNYRLLTGLYDGQNDHDAVTLGQLNTRLGSLTITTISQSDYNNLQTKDPDTLYVITGA